MPDRKGLSDVSPGRKSTISTRSNSTHVSRTSSDSGPVEHSGSTAALNSDVESNREYGMPTTIDTTNPHENDTTNGKTHNGVHHRHYHKFYKGRKKSTGSPAPHEQHRVLACTVDAGVTDNRVYPPDGLCDYLLFRNVLFQKGKFIAADNESASLSMFKEASRDSNATAFGYALDFGTFDTVAEGNRPVDMKPAIVNAAARHAIRGIGVLDLTNVLLDEDMNSTQRFFQENRKSLPSEGFMFIGIEAPSSINQLLRLAHIAKDVDIAILRTHVEFSPDSPCVVAYPGAWAGRGQPGQRETVQILGNLTNDTSTAWLVSFQLGVLAYEGSSQVLDVGQNCSTHYTLGYDDVCREQRDTVVDEQALVVFQQGKGSGTYRTFETSETLERKIVLFLNAMASCGIHVGVALFDIQFENYETDCSSDNTIPRRFSRLSTTKYVLELYTV
ncbi:uncharacterized protein LOC135397128 isoform X2 [Ornithodoros turicata]|uniref:uncharacterized protein LOC135397128 isoform X2 n=1 Tax=Ornithodoros turicata TaxID=34597 RepID=UPI00313865C1